jgi:hypothetical protein
MSMQEVHDEFERRISAIEVKLGLRPAPEAAPQAAAAAEPSKDAATETAPDPSATAAPAAQAKSSKKSVLPGA